jgi:hypothetical protein
LRKTTAAHRDFDSRSRTIIVEAHNRGPAENTPSPKTGRNEPCPCGSGKKYKRCHGAPPPTQPVYEAPEETLRQREIAREFQRRKQQGLGRPIISTVNERGQRAVAVGGKGYVSTRWGNFQDFLWEFVVRTLGVEWFQAEQDKPEADRHPVFRWYELSLAQMREGKKGGAPSLAMTGAMEAYYRFAYNLYLLAHNGGIPASLLSRLKKTKNFRGPELELFVAATFIKAGFTIEFEDETDSNTSHCEFTVTSVKSGRKFSVEAKARDVDFSTTELRGLLVKALKKRAEHTRIAWFAIHAAAESVEAANAAMRETLQELRSREGQITIDGQPAPPAIVIVSNNSFEFALDHHHYSPSAFAEGFQIPDFKFDQKFTCVREMRLTRDKYVEIHDLIHSIDHNYSIPVTFDGEDPAFASGHVDERLMIGSVYDVPNGDQIVKARLEFGTVLENERRAMLTFRTLSGENCLIWRDLTDAEMGAYSRHKETFFGVIDPNGKARDPLELFEWMHQTQRHWSKEKLLAELKNYPLIGEFQTFTQGELAIRYCEIIVDQIYRQQQMKTPSV